MHQFCAENFVALLQHNANMPTARLFPSLAPVACESRVALQGEGCKSACQTQLLLYEIYTQDGPCKPTCVQEQLRHLPSCNTPLISSHESVQLVVGNRSQ